MVQPTLVTDTRFAFPAWRYPPHFPIVALSAAKLHAQMMVIESKHVSTYWPFVRSEGKVAAINAPEEDVE